MAAISLGMSIFGGISSSEAAKKQAAAQQQMISIEEQQDQVRRTAMEIDAQRKQLQILRNNQSARALALAGAVQGGGQFGSGLQGGYGEISGISGTNLLGVNQDLASGEKMFGLNAKLDQAKIAYAQAGGQVATGQAFQGFGQAVAGAEQPFHNLFGGSNPFNQPGGITGLAGTQWA